MTDHTEQVTARRRCETYGCVYQGRVHTGDCWIDFATVEFEPDEDGDEQ